MIRAIFSSILAANWAGRYCSRSRIVSSWGAAKNKIQFTRKIINGMSPRIKQYDASDAKEPTSSSIYLLIKHFMKYTAAGSEFFGSICPPCHSEKHHKKGGIKKQISFLYTSFCCTQSEISVYFIIAPTLTVRPGFSSHWHSYSEAAWKEPSCACGYWKASLPPIHHHLSIPKRIQG